MIQQALDYIFSKAEEKQNPIPHIEHLGGRKRAVTLNGVRTIEEIEPETLKRRADTIESLVAIVSKFKGNSPTIFIEEDGIEAVLDDSDRRERVVMDFTYSSQFEELSAIANGYSQRSLVRSLRTGLAGCVQNAEILNLVRQVEFRTEAAGRGAINHQSDSMGKSVERVVRANAGEIPETLRVIVPLFSVPHDIPTEMELTCAVDIDMDNQKIALIPTGDSLLREKKRVIASIQGQLEDMAGDIALVVAGRVVH